MGRALGKILKKISSVLIIIVILLAFLLVGVRLLGIQVYTVLSGSMEPSYRTGSLIYVREVDADELEEGDVITFRLGGGATATHRIIELVYDESNPEIVRFRTKGDANEMIDASLVESGSVVGTPIFTIPYLGFFANFIQRPPGIYLAIAVSAVLVLLVMLADMLVGEKDKKHKKIQ